MDTIDKQLEQLGSVRSDEQDVNYRDELKGVTRAK